MSKEVLNLTDMHTHICTLLKLQCNSVEKIQLILCKQLGKGESAKKTPTTLKTLSSKFSVLEHSTQRAGQLVLKETH